MVARPATTNRVSQSPASSLHTDEGLADSDLWRVKPVGCLGHREDCRVLLPDRIADPSRGGANSSAYRTEDERGRCPAFAAFKCFACCNHQTEDSSTNRSNYELFQDAVPYGVSVLEMDLANRWLAKFSGNAVDFDSCRRISNATNRADSYFSFGIDDSYRLAERSRSSLPNRMRLLTS